MQIPKIPSEHPFSPSEPYQAFQQQSSHMEPMLTCYPQKFKGKPVNIKFVISVSVLLNLVVDFHSLQKQPPEVLYKKLFLKILENSQENTCARVF